MRFRVRPRQVVQCPRVLHALRLLLAAQLVTRPTLREPGLPARPRLTRLPQRLSAGLPTARAQVRLIRCQRPPQVTLQIVQVIYPVAPRPAVSPTDLEVDPQHRVGGYDLRNVGKSGAADAKLRAMTRVFISPVDRVGSSDEICSTLISGSRSPSSVSAHW